MIEENDRPELTVRGFAYALAPSLALWAFIVGTVALILQ